MEATIGTLAASNSIDLTEQIESTNNIISSSTASAPEDFEGKRIMAGVNIVTGGCGTYAVTSKNGVTVYPWKTTKAEEVATMTQKENDIPPFLPTDTKPLSLTTTPSTHPQSLDHIFYAVTRLPVSSSIHPILKSWSSSSSDPLPKSQDKLFYNPVNGLDNNNSRATTAATNSNYNFARRSNFRLKFADRVQVVEMESDGWAKLARGNGYILAEHGQGSDLVKGVWSDIITNYSLILHKNKTLFLLTIRSVLLLTSKGSELTNNAYSIAFYCIFTPFCSRWTQRQSLSY